MKTLQELKEGDTVIRRSLGIGNWCEATTVERITKNFVIIQGGTRFNMNGRETGTTRPNYIHIPEDGEIEEMAKEEIRKALARKMNEMDWRNVSLDKIQRVDAILKEPEPVEP